MPLRRQTLTDLTNEFGKLVNGPNGLAEQVRAIESALSEVGVRRFISNPATKTYIETRSPSAFLFRIYSEFARCKFIVSAVGDKGMARRLSTLENVLRTTQAKNEPQLLEVLPKAAENQLGQYKHWLVTFEALASEPGRVGLEIEWESHLLSLRDYLEYATMGMVATGIDGNLRNVLGLGTDLEQRLRKLIADYFPRLLKAYSQYHVPDPQYFPDRFWWRKEVWAVRNRSSLRRAS